MTEYEVVIGFDTPDARFEPGDKVQKEDIPEVSLGWLVEQSIIRESEGGEDK